MLKTLTLLAGLLAAMPAMAADATVGTLTVVQPTARPSLGPSKTSAAFFTITNSGAAADQLVKAESTVATTVELHTHIREGDIMRMRPVADITVPANGSVALEPGSFHVMLIGVTAPLKAGDSFPLTLTFAKAGKVEVNVAVVPVGAAGGGHQGHKH